METWLPTDPDLVILRQWILTSDLGTPANLMAQQILSSINWGTTHKVGSLNYCSFFMSLDRLTGHSKDFIVYCLTTVCP